MDTFVIQHVPVSELPPAWREKLHATSTETVTVTIEEEVATLTENPLFGMWRDRDDTQDVAAYVRHLRHPRYRADGTRIED